MEQLAREAVAANSAACSAPMASLRSCSPMTRLRFMRELPCETILTFTACKAPKTTAATPGVSRMASPTRQTIACPPACDTSAMEASSSVISSSRSSQSMVSDTPTSEVETTSTAVRWRSKIANASAKNPWAINIRVERMSTTVIPSL